MTDAVLVKGESIFPHYLQFVLHLNEKEMVSPPQLHPIMLFKDSALIPHQHLLQATSGFWIPWMFPLLAPDASLSQSIPGTLFLGSDPLVPQ